ncbi:MAG: CPBP family intramembrane metalloprotease, partial [Deltaproteobacteria bacterium]|nr:CPBP family intramembrane metalloprotease [Deltaproteobacteria bacterium]
MYRAHASATHLQAAILVALAEEMAFRYAALFELQGRLGGAGAALALTSALFAAMHLWPGGAGASWRRLLDLLLFAVLLGALTL